MNPAGVVTVTIDCPMPDCAGTRAAMAVAINGSTPFTCLDCEAVWWADVIDAETTDKQPNRGATGSVTIDIPAILLIAAGIMSLRLGDNHFRLTMITMCAAAVGAVGCLYRWPRFRIGGRE